MLPAYEIRLVPFHREAGFFCYDVGSALSLCYVFERSFVSPRATWSLRFAAQLGRSLSAVRSLQGEICYTEPQSAVTGIDHQDGSGWTVRGGVASPMVAATSTRWVHCNGVWGILDTSICEVQLLVLGTSFGKPALEARLWWVCLVVHNEYPKLWSLLYRHDGARGRIYKGTPDHSTFQENQGTQNKG